MVLAASAFAEYETLYLVTLGAICVVILAFGFSTLGSDIEDGAKWRMRGKKKKGVHMKVAGAGSVLSDVGSIVGILAIPVALVLVGLSLFLSACATTQEGLKTVSKSIHGPIPEQAAPSSIPASAFDGLRAIRGEGEDGGRTGTVIVYGRQTDQAFYPVAWKARFTGVPHREYGDEILPRNGNWELMASVKSGVGVSPVRYIRADGKWQSGWTTKGSFANGRTVEMVITIGDAEHRVFVPVGL